MRAWTWYRGQAASAQVAVALIATLALLGAVIGMWALIVAMTSTALPA